MSHELLLICTRGSCKPDISTLYSSVQKIPREGHSVKPEHFRHLIDALYTKGPRLELFARAQVEGWDSWGNEIVPSKGTQNGFHGCLEAGD